MTEVFRVTFDLVKQLTNLFFEVDLWVQLDMTELFTCHFLDQQPYFLLLLAIRLDFKCFEEHRVEFVNLKMV